MSVIRPPASPQTPPAAPARVSGDARAAFFQSALKGTAPVAPAPAVSNRPAEPVTPAQRLRDEHPSPQQPQRLLRPGSLLDIKV